MASTNQWDEYRRRRNIFWLVWVTYVPGVLALGLPLRSLLSSDIPIYVVAVAWMIAFVVSGNWMTMWKCPRCRQAFFRTFWGGNPLATRCVHCRLPKWTSDAA
jgi:hypothetical protein